jgi:multiple sugar transport system substrate-binding protein
MRTGTGLTRRTTLALGAAAPALLGLAGCGPNTSSSSVEDDGDANSLRFAWWGNNVRNELTAQAIDAYTAANEGVTISAEPGDWSGYWDKLATQAAAKDAPDIIQMDEKYISEYGGRGALLDLAAGGLDTSKFEDSVVATGEYQDMGLLAICAGINTPVLLANPAVFDAAGVDLPDDTTWTWDDLLEITKKISEGTEDGVFGIQQIGLVQAAFQVYVRQLGKDQYNAEGVGFTAEDAGEFFEFMFGLQQEGAAPDASLAVEDSGKSLDQTMFGTGELGLVCAWSNQVVAFDEVLDGTVELLRMPSMTGKATDANLWYKSSQYFSVNANSAKTEAAVAFVDFLVNTTEAGKILLAERGVPGNLDVREAIVGDLTESDVKVVDFIEAIKDELGEAPILTPQGGGGFEDMQKRACEDMLFERTDPTAAGQALFDE